MNPELEFAAKALARGEAVIYPTETLYALGAVALNHRALERVIALKGREAGKPLPVIIAGLDQLPMICARDDEAVRRLIRDFWPGPLSILVPARPELSPLIQDHTGTVAVRWSPHPTAQALARACRAPLAATSANPSGGDPVSRPEDLDPALASAVAAILDFPPFPAGAGPPPWSAPFPPLFWRSCARAR